MSNAGCWVVRFRMHPPRFYTSSIGPPSELGATRTGKEKKGQELRSASWCRDRRRYPGGGDASEPNRETQARLHCRRQRTCARVCDCMRVHKSSRGPAQPHHASQSKENRHTASTRRRRVVRGEVCGYGASARMRQRRPIARSGGTRAWDAVLRRVGWLARVGELWVCEASAAVNARANAPLVLIGANV